MGRTIENEKDYEEKPRRGLKLGVFGILGYLLGVASLVSLIQRWSSTPLWKYFADAIGLYRAFSDALKALMFDWWISFPSWLFDLMFLWFLCFVTVVRVYGVTGGRSSLREILTWAGVKWYAKDFLIAPWKAREQFRLMYRYGYPKAVRLAKEHMAAGHTSILALKKAYRETRASIGITNAQFAVPVLTILFFVVNAILL